jgi:hypothetical protein
MWTLDVFHTISGVQTHHIGVVQCSLHANIQVMFPGQLDKSADPAVMLPQTRRRMT